MRSFLAMPRSLCNQGKNCHLFCLTPFVRLRIQPEIQKNHRPTDAMRPKGGEMISPPLDVSAVLMV